jgi:hypothetical protein
MAAKVARLACPHVWALSAADRMTALYGPSPA